MSEQLEDKISRDSGYTSRKWWMTIITMVLIVATGFAGGVVITMNAALPVIVGGLVTCLMAYMGINLGTKWTAANLAKAKASKPKGR